MQLAEQSGISLVGDRRAGQSFVPGAECKLFIQDFQSKMNYL